MRKRIAWILAAALVLLCGCSGRQQELETAQAELEAAKQEVAELQLLVSDQQQIQRTLEEENAALKTELSDLGAQIDQLAQDFYDLTSLKPAEKICVVGTMTTALSDGEQLYIDASLLGGPFAEAYCREQNGTDYVQLEYACQRLGLYQGETPEGVRLVAWQKHPEPSVEGRTVPVLMYHAVSDEIWGQEDLFVSPADLEIQLRYLEREGYETIWFEDLAHLEDYEKPILLTFDDGYEDNYLEMLPLLQKYQAKVTIFVIGSMLNGRQYFMNAEQVREMVDSGLVSIQSHTYSHHKLSELSESEIRSELENSRTAIAAVTGELPYVISYPNGGRTDFVLSAARELYSFGVSTEEGFFVTGAARVDIPRYKVWRETSLQEFADILEQAQ